MNALRCISECIGACARSLRKSSLFDCFGKQVKHKRFDFEEKSKKKVKKGHYESCSSEIACNYYSWDEMCSPFDRIEASCREYRLRINEQTKARSMFDELEQRYTSEKRYLTKTLLDELNRLCKRNDISMSDWFMRADCECEHAVNESCDCLSQQHSVILRARIGQLEGESNQLRFELRLAEDVIDMLEQRVKQLEYTHSCRRPTEDMSSLTTISSFQSSQVTSFSTSVFTSSSSQQVDSVYDESSYSIDMSSDEYDLEMFFKT